MRLSNFYLAILIQILPGSSAFQVSPSGKGSQPKTSADSFVEDELTNAPGISPLAFESSVRVAAFHEDFEDTLDNLLSAWKTPTTPAFACLFVGRSYRSNLQEIVDYAQERLGSQTQVLTIIGGGAIGGGRESEDSHSISFFGGELPEGAEVDLFSMTHDQQDFPSSLTAPTSVDSGSHLIFADPHFQRMNSVLENIEGIAGGGISVAGIDQPSLAIGTEVLPPRSLIGATFSGTVGLQVVVSRGCCPVGPPYRITNVEGPVIHELDNESALDRLHDVLAIAKEEAAGKTTFQLKNFLGGIRKDSVANELPLTESREFMMRQMTGFRPRTGSILMCGSQLENGDLVQFHLQSKETALNDWQSTLKLVETERLFLGPQVGSTLGALQVSCMGRGESLFGVPNVDHRHIQRLLPEETPISGFMANAEIGPTCTRMGATEARKSVLHGFASIVILICDYSNASDPMELPTVSTLGNSTTAGVWE